ncbi:MAG: class I SAM-dependent methyltransferase [Gammaproteobacteria bacterium]|nr:class I SAM-dependent methyltransferase [Gammaproteobacteria bacterium]
MHAHEFKIHAELEDHHWWFKARRNVILTLLLRFSSKGVRHIVEIGCGTGGNLRLLGEYADKVTGVDVSSDAIEYAKERVNGDMLLGDYHVLKDKWHDVDVVLLADVLEHIEDDTGFLGDIIESLKPGTLIIITVPAHKILWSNHDVALGHKRRYQANTLNNLWENKPVEELFFSPFNFILSPLVFLNRFLQSKDKNTQQSDLEEHSVIVNALLYFLFNLESRWMRYFSLPWGCSYAVALKKI